MKIRLNMPALSLVMATCLAFAFGAWSLNPGVWLPETRACAAVLACLAFCLAVYVD